MKQVSVNRAAVPRRFRSFGVVAAAVALAALSVGCETIRNAREAQKRVEPAAAAPEVSERREVPALPFTKESRLADYVTYATSNRPEVVAAFLNVEKALLAVTTAESEWYPSISAGGGHSQSTANNGSHFSWRNAGKANGNVSLDWTLLDFGRTDADVKSAREAAFAAQAAYLETANTVFSEVATAYFTLRRDDALLEVAQSNLLQYAEHLRQSETLLEAQEAKKLDVLRARLDVSQARLDMLKASNDVVTASAEFLRVLGLDATLVPRDLVLPASASALDRCRMELEATQGKPADFLALARSDAPHLAQYRALLRVASADVDYAVADLMPKLSLSSAFSFADPTWNWSWGFSVVQSVFEGFRKTTAVDAAVVAMAKARTDVTREEEQLAHDIAVAVSARDVARDSLETATVKVRQARENLDTVEAEFKVGDASRVDFTDAASSWASALGARVTAFYDGQMAEASLVNLKGGHPVYVDQVVDMGAR